MLTITSKNIYIEFAKFIQNNLLENNIDCYLIGGSLINAVRDNGVLLSDDIDFAVLNEGNIEKIFETLSVNAPSFAWIMNDSFISLFLSGDSEQKVDLFIYDKRHLNYYMKSVSWINEKIHSFQTFKPSKVILENKEFYTLHKPDVFLRGVYGDYMLPKKDYYPNTKGGDYSHAKECVFYTSTNNYDFIDFQVENLKIFFQTVNVKRNCNNIDDKKINVFDSQKISVSDTTKVLVYKDFINYLIKNNINHHDC